MRTEGGSAGALEAAASDQRDGRNAGNRQVGPTFEERCVLLASRDSAVRFAAVDMPEANDLTVGIMALVAQAEREAISRRTKEALARAKARRVKLGPEWCGEPQAVGLGKALRVAVSANAAAFSSDLAAV